MTKVDAERVPSKFRCVWPWLLCLGLAVTNLLTLLDQRAYTTGFDGLTKLLTPVLSESALSRVFGQSPAARYTSLEKAKLHIESQHKALQQKAIRTSSRIAKRAAQNALKNFSSLPAEAIPVLGVAAVAAVTSSDLYDDCQSIKDAIELSEGLGEIIADDERICGMELPDWAKKLLSENH